MEKNKNSVTVVGLGYVGLPLAVQAAKRGYEVTGIDIDIKKVKKINKHISPFKDEDLTQKLKEVSLKATTNFSSLKKAKIVIICVPTPIYENRLPNYEPLKSACKSVGLNLSRGTLVVLESTVNPGVCEGLVLSHLEKFSGLKAGEFQLAHCPERINPGDDKWNVGNIARVVGGIDQESTDQAVAFYESVIDAPIKPMNSIKEAEAVKIVENSFRNINIAFVNELAQSFNKLGIDTVNVIEGAGTKPFAFMPHLPGCGVGGHCIPVDPYYLIDYAEKNGYDHRFLSLACKINEEMPEYTVDLFRKEMNSLGKKIKGSQVALLGLAYKANIGDIRESPALTIFELLKKHGVSVRPFDPYVSENKSPKTLDEAIDGVDAVIVTTSHTDFLDLTPDLLIQSKVNILIDGRNFFNKEEFLEKGIVYRGIGR